MVLSKKYIVLNPFVGEPKKSDFKIIEEELPPLQENEFLAEAAYFSVDPYQRVVRPGVSFPCDLIGGQVAKILESRNADYPIGTWIMGHYGWRTHTISKPEIEFGHQRPFMYKLPDFGDVPISLAAGMCGRAGNTAYFGFTEICKPKPGETVVVSGAAGAVGTHVGQIAKILGCHVIGIAGTDEKCNWLVNELGFDSAINYKTENIADFLKEKAPNGIDCYFDNVGGEISSTVISQMKQYGRVSVCGAISSYNETDPEKRKATAIQPFVVRNQLKIEGFLVNQFADRTMEGIRQNLQWIQEGKLKYREHVTEGFESAIDAFIGIFHGDNTGKALVKVK